jgi:hypothetical protein
MHLMVNTALIPLVIPRFKEVEPKLPYMCPGSYIAHMVIHCGKIDAMFDYLNRVNISYIMTKGSQKYYRAANISSLSVAFIGLTIVEAA